MASKYGMSRAVRYYQVFEKLETSCLWKTVLKSFNLYLSSSDSFARVFYKGASNNIVQR